MISENWKLWTPAPGLEYDYYLLSILDTAEQFNFTLATTDNESHEVTFSFDCSIAGYRQIEEGCRLILFKNLSKKYGVSFYARSSFFIVESSRFISSITNSEHLIHFSFFTSDFIIDVAAKKHPKVTINNSAL